jgi:methylglutaconyl-CoA hydratase
MTHLLFEQRGSAKLITLNRPEVRNALSRPLRAELAEALAHVKDDPKVRSVILTGAGTAFCAGLDLEELEALQRATLAETTADVRALAELFYTIYTFPKPVIAAVNGHAVAGGAGLASVCDLTIMSETAKLGYTEARIGFVAALVGVYLVRQVGEKRARELLLSARLIGAQEALSYGLATAVVGEGEALEAALATAEQLAANAPSSLTLSKQLLSHLYGMGLRESLDYASQLNILSRQGGELKEGIRAFLEKRKPAW